MVALTAIGAALLTLFALLAIRSTLGSSLGVSLLKLHPRLPVPTLLQLMIDHPTNLGFLLLEANVNVLSSANPSISECINVSAQHLVGRQDSLHSCTNSGPQRGWPEACSLCIGMLCTANHG
jgi:hypothetical protein